MQHKAVFIGSIGVLTESSEMQRRAYNRAFDAAGLPWQWEGAAYYAMLRKPGGLGRILDYAAQHGVQVDARALHRAKLEHFATLAKTEGLALRPGVADYIMAAKQAGMAVGLVTTTVPATLGVIFDALGDALPRDAFDMILTRADVITPKPHGECYKVALHRLGLAPHQAIAVEDTPESQNAATAAGLTCVACPGFAAKTRSFDPGQPFVRALSADMILPQRLSA